MAGVSVKVRQVARCTKPGAASSGRGTKSGVQGYAARPLAVHHFVCSTFRGHHAAMGCSCKARRANPEQRTSPPSMPGIKEREEQMLRAISRRSDQSAPETQDGRGYEAPEELVRKVRRGGKKHANKQPQGLRILKGGLYSHPSIYDNLNSYKDYEAEVDFLFDAFESLCGREPTTFAELGCGPAQHSLEMAESGLTVFALDTSASMLGYAQQLATEDGLQITCLEQDMRSIHLPGDTLVDLVACLNGTFQHLHLPVDARTCFEAVHTALVPGGLFVIELNHPATLFDGSAISSGDTWEVASEGYQAEVWWGHPDDRWNPMTQIIDRSVAVNVMMRGGEAVRLEDTLSFRQYTFQELLLLGSITGYQFERVYNDFKLDSEIEPTSSWQTGEAEEATPSTDEEEDEPFRMILVFKKPNAAIAT